jgi:hypothetical protein
VLSTQDIAQVKVKVGNATREDFTFTVSSPTSAASKFLPALLRQLLA